MGLQIDMTTVSRLLLKDGVWYEVLPGSLTIDSFEWTDSDGLVLNGEDPTAGPRIGVRFKSRGLNGWISGPISSILAVHYEPVELEDPLGVSMPAILADEIDPPRA